MQSVNKQIDEKKEEQPEIVIDDPFAPLDTTTNVLFENENTSKIEKDESAMDVLGGLLSANPEFESNEEKENVTSTFVDFAKYEEIKDEKIDYDNLTKVSAVDEYKIVSIEETVISEDADGKQTIVKTVDVKDDDVKQDLEDVKEQQLAHQTIDIDNFMKKNGAQNVLIDDDMKEESSSSSSEEENESMGSEIIHDTPRQSEVLHEKLDSQIFGAPVDDENGAIDEHSSSSSSEDENVSNSQGTDPNGY